VSSRSSQATPDVAAPEFTPGRELARAFYEEVVAPLLDGVEHSAALLGTGSDVLGFDTVRSTDHAWGPRLQVFVAGDEIARVGALVDESLPDEFRGWPTRFGWDDVPVSHHVTVTTLDVWLRNRLGFDPLQPIALESWLVTPQQILLEVTEGAVFRDEDGALSSAREALAWYPDDVWLWLVACQWRRIDQEEPFVGRTAEVGDELGSRVLCARLVRDAVRLAFLLERRYAPYSKWLGSGFQRLRAHGELGPPLESALAADAYEERETALVAAMETLARLHNAAGITPPVDEQSGWFHDRPFRVLGSARFVDACLEQVSDERLRALPLVGGIDQVADSTDVLSSPRMFDELAATYRALIESPASPSR
jgi:uncharacterized protein DUF4037